MAAERLRIITGWLWLTAAVVLGLAQAGPSWAIDYEVATCDGAEVPEWQRSCRIGDRLALPPPPAPPPAEVEVEAPAGGPPASVFEEMAESLRVLAEAERRRQEIEAEKSPLVRDPNAPMWVHRLANDPGKRENLVEAIQYLGRIGNLHQDITRGTRGVIREMLEGGGAPDLEGAMAEHERYEGGRFRQRDPADVIRANRTSALTARLEHDLGPREAAAPPPPADGIGQIRLSYVLSPSCPACKDVTPEIAKFHALYHRAVEVEGVPVALPGERITPRSLEEYRRANEIYFPLIYDRARAHRRMAELFELVPPAYQGTPLVVLEFPEIGYRVPLVGAATVEDLQGRVLAEIEALRATSRGAQRATASIGGAP